MKEKSLTIKILSGYLIVLALIGCVILILLHERQCLHEIEAGVAINRELRHDISSVHRNFTELATLGEFAISWEKADYQSYRAKRLETDSLLQKLQNHCAKFICSEQIDTLCGLLASKEQHLLHIMQAFHKQEKVDSLLINHLPVVAKQATHTNEITRKKKGLAGLFGKKETVQVVAPAKPLHELNEKLIEMQKEHRQDLENNTDMVRRKNKELNSELMSLISQIDGLIQIAFQEKDKQLEDMRQESFRLVTYVLIVAGVLLFISYLIIQWDLRQKEKTRRTLEDCIGQNKALLEMRKKIILTISHDIRGPLGSINGSAELAIDTRDKRKRNIYLENIRTSCRHILHLVNNLLDIYRMNEWKEARNEVVFRLDKLIERIVNLYSQASNNKGLLFTTQLSGVGITAKGDADRIEQILDNLLVNAIKFTKSGEICFIVAYGNGQLTMRIRDTGIGMSEETLSRIFEPFERAAQEVNSEGFGLGLSITKGLVNLLNGEIFVESTVSKGSVFSVVLPLTETCEKETEDIKPNVGMTRLPRQVLVVDDDSLQLGVIKEMLERNGVFCETCSNAKEVVQALRKRDFDLILTDVQMPGTDGFNLLRLLRNSNIGNSRTVPVIVMTAHGDQEAHNFIEAGFLDCIYKPFSTKELLSSISSVVEKEKITESDIDFKTLTSEISDKKKILELFVEESEKSIAELEDFLEAADRIRLRGTIHRMLPVWELLQTDDTLIIYRQMLHDENTDNEIIRKETERIIAYAHELVVKAKNEMVDLKHET